MRDALIDTALLADGTTAVTIRGDVDIATSDSLRTMLVETLTRQRPVRLVVDMLYVTFLDSTGIGALMAGQHTAEALGIPFGVRNPSPFVAQLLHNTGIYEALTDAP